MTRKKFNKESESVICLTTTRVALNSPDHLYPVGAKNDNSTNGNYIMEVEKYFKNKHKIKRINYLDLGCAGGQLVTDFYVRGHFAVGLEGSDIGVRDKLFNWPKFGGSLLHTADITKEFRIHRSGKRVFFDMISMWEVMEHIKREEISKVLDNVLENLAPGGLFIASINTTEDTREDENGNIIHLHQSVYPEEVWRNEILKNYKVVDYPFHSKVRNHPSGSFFIAIKKKGRK